MAHNSIDGTRRNHGPRPHGVFVWDMDAQCYKCHTHHRYPGTPPAANPAGQLLERMSRRANKPRTPKGKK